MTTVVSALNRDIRLERNGQFREVVQITNADEEPISLSGATLEMKAKAQAGDTDILASAVIVILNSSQGIFQYTWTGSNFDGYGSVYAETRCAYDMRVTYSDGYSPVYLKGQLILTPEVTP